MATLTDEQRAELRAKYGDEVAVVQNKKHGDFVFRKPDRPIWRAYRHATKDEARTDQRDELCKNSLVFPEKSKGEPDLEKADDLLEEYPGLADTLFQRLGKLAGMDDELVGKL